MAPDKVIDIMITSEYLTLRRKRDKEEQNRTAERKTASVPPCLCGYGRYLIRPEVCERCGKQPLMKLAA